MGKLIVDGKNVFEIDEECVRHRHIPKECGIYAYLNPKDEGKKERPINKKPYHNEKEDR